MEAVQTQPIYPRGPDFEQVWASLQEVTERQREITRQQEETNIQIKEINRIIKEITHHKDTDQKIEENAEQLEEDQEKEEIAKENKRLWDEVVGETLYFGDVPDYMLLTFLFKKFWKIGLDFSVAQPNYYVSDKVNQISVGADFMLRNNDKEMLVKIKKELTAEDVEEHVECLEKMRLYADLHGDSELKSKRAFLGTVAGVAVTANVKEYALGQGLYVMEPSGVSFKITPPQDNPKEW